MWVGTGDDWQQAELSCILVPIPDEQLDIGVHLATELIEDLSVVLTRHDVLLGLRPRTVDKTHPVGPRHVTAFDVVIQLLVDVDLQRHRRGTINLKYYYYAIHRGSVANAGFNLIALRSSFTHTTQVFFRSPLPLLPLNPPKSSTLKSHSHIALIFVRFPPTLTASLTNTITLSTQVIYRSYP